jgi:hypothetical protein
LVVCMDKGTPDKGGDERTANKRCSV